MRQILAEKFPHLRRGSGGALVLVVGYNFVTCTPQLQPAPLAGGGGYILYRWLATAVLSRLIEGHNSSSIIEELPNNRLLNGSTPGRLKPVQRCTGLWIQFPGIVPVAQP